MELLPKYKQVLEGYNLEGLYPNELEVIEEALLLYTQGRDTMQNPSCKDIARLQIAERLFVSIRSNRTKC